MNLPTPSSACSLTDNSKQTLALTLTAGKRTYSLDLTKASDRKHLSSLIQDADVIMQAFRLGSLERKGFGLEDIIEMSKKRHIVLDRLFRIAFHPLPGIQPDFLCLRFCSIGFAVLLCRLVFFQAIQRDMHTLTSKCQVHSSSVEQQLLLQTARLILVLELWHGFPISMSFAPSFLFLPHPACKFQLLLIRFMR